MDNIIEMLANDNGEPHLIEADEEANLLEQLENPSMDDESDDEVIEKLFEGRMYQ